MAERQKAGGYGLPEPDFDPTTAPLPKEAAAERPFRLEPVEQDELGRVVEKPKKAAGKK